MKGSISTYLKKLHRCLLSVGAAALTAVTVISCSDVTRTPPDDDEGSVREKASCFISNDSSDQSAAFAFLACSAEVVQAVELSDADRFALSSCDFESARAQDASAEHFESVRALIREKCL